MKKWFQSFLGLDQLKQSHNVNLENQRLLVEQNTRLIEEISEIKNNPPKNEIHYINLPEDLPDEKLNQPPLPVLEEFSLKGGQETTEISFSLTDSELLSNEFFEVSQSQEGQFQLSSMMSSIASSGASFQAAAYSTKGLFQATVSPDKLMTYKDGLVSSMVKGADGKMTQHAGFTQTGTSAFSPLLAIQFASILTGQYYFNGITKQLDKVLDKLDHLERMHHIEREAKMKYAFNQLQHYSNLSAFTVEDFVNIKQIAYDLQVIRNEYYIASKEVIDSIKAFIQPENLESESEEYDLSDAKTIEKALLNIKGGVNDTVKKVSHSNLGRKFKSIKGSVGKFVTNSIGKVKKIEKKINDLAPYYTFKSAITAEELYQISRLVELKMNLAVKDLSADRMAKIQELKNELSRFKKEDLLHESLYAEVKKFQSVIHDRFIELKAESNIDKVAIQQLIQRSQSQFTQLEDISRNSIKTINSLHEGAIKSFNKKSEVLLDNRGPKPRLYMKMDKDSNQN